MVSLHFAPLPLAAAALMLASQAVAGAPAIASFRQIEFGADPAAMVDTVRADLAARIPAGSAVVDARALLRRAGAHCGTPAADGRVRCRYSDIHIQDDILQDVRWTVDLQTAGERVVSLAVARDPAFD